MIAAAAEISGETIKGALLELMDHYGYDTKQVSIEAKKFLAETLSEQAGRADKPWSYNYIHGVLFNGTKPGDEFKQAVLNLAARMDGMIPEYTQAKKMTLYVIGNIRPGSLVMGESRKCALEGCPVWFVARTARAKYHSEQCRREADKLRKRERSHASSL